MRRAVVVLVVVVTLVGAANALANAIAGSAQIENPYPDCRFGVGVSGGGNVTTYDTSQLGVGWYTDWGASTSSARPNGIQHLKTIRVRQNKSGSTYLPGHVLTPTLSMNPGGLGPIVQANPGAIWIIGNEPDRVEVQDDTMPDEFAKAYKEAYDFIKSLDPTARVAMPGLVEVTPLRLKYLDAVLSAYASQNGGAHMPVDVWTVHIYILPEGVAWGAHYPVGITPTAQTPAMMYTIGVHDSQAVFQQQVRDMRNWMSQNGYRDTPLIFTEFGILYPSDYRDENGNDFSAPRVNAFMNGVLDFFRTATDANTGYPADGNRLVQAWAWYSTADTAFNGRLFDPATGALTSIGQNYSNYTRALGPDLLVSKLPQQAAFSPGGPVTATLTAYVYNRGYTAFGGTYTLTFYSNISYTQAIGSIVVQGLPSQATQTVQVTWPSVSPGLYPFYTRLDTSGGESNACNNVNSSVLLVATHQVFLPGLSKSQ